MHKLEPHEIRCLRAIHDGAHSELGGPCSATVISLLLAKGLIINSPELFLPLPLFHYAYSITEAGKEALRQSKAL